MVVEKIGEDLEELGIDELFNDDETPASTEQTPEQVAEAKLKQTQAVTARINEVKTKIEKETLDRVAKELGYESYAVMKKAEETKLIKDKGYNPEDLEKVLEPILKKRLEDDPRLKRLEALEQRERDEYVQTQLTAINEATGQQLKITDLAPETLELWGKGINLEQAYYASQGKQLIAKAKTQTNNGSLDHLAVGSGSQQPKLRRLTEQEKDIYRSIAPHITEDELNKKTTPIIGK